MWIIRSAAADYLHPSGTIGGLTMWKDPIVEEIRRYREEYAAQFNFDLHAICEDLRNQQGKNGRQVISLPPKRIAKSPDAGGKPAA
jgi:hypothetical protein